MTLLTPPPIDAEDEEMLVPHADFAPEGPQPMEVAPAEATNTVDAQAVYEPPSARFTWTIENFSKLNLKKQYSEVFLVGGYKWRVLLFPKGNNVDHLSMYLDVADSSALPYGWSRYAQFSLSVINQIHSKFTIRKDTQHQFNSRESDWGFTSFMPLSELYDPGRGYLVNDTCIVEADVAVRRVVDYWSHDSKKETGYVGLKNQGATCYMNSLLQTLYHIPYFRKAVYHMPTTENDNPSGSIPLALQSLFYKLQYSDTSVATKELTKSFGWDTYDSFMQHDVQELNRVLCEKLEDKMKGTVVEGTIQQLFEGHHMNYIECINVDYKSTRKESFYDLQLDVKGCKDIYASFDKYVEEERLEGDNKYHAEQYGLQDARKGVLFIDFPPVLQLQLKRFEYDFVRDTMVKINDRYEFPLQLDLDRENGKYLSPDADRSVRNLYTLHSVLVHSGGVHGGHYYAYIRPTLSDQWKKLPRSLGYQCNCNASGYGQSAKIIHIGQIALSHLKRKLNLKTTSMEESNSMTIEFLRARLLSERSVSKTARQRADELAKRVAELEEQLKFVSLQRKKAEKATANVLAILENQGISDVSEEFDSCSEQEESPQDFEAHNGTLMMKETSTNVKLRKNEKEAYSSSEIESSPSTGRSLSWRSTKDSQHSLEKKKYMDSVRRRASFSSNSSSARRVGKSCRRIRRRETRSIEELQNGGTEKAACSRDDLNCSDGEPVASAESSGYANGKNPLESPTLGPISGTQNVNGHYYSVHENDEDMESALQHQAQLIGRYEEEEKAQREWEEKFRENNSGTQDSCDPGNHSDVTEERYETKSPELSRAADTLDSYNREMKQEPADAGVSEEPQTSKSLPSATDADKGSLEDEKYSSGIIAGESSASEFSFPMSEKSDQDFSRKQHEASAHGYQQSHPMVSTIAQTPANISSPYVGKSMPLSASPRSSSSFELAVVPRETSNSLGSVLEALQRAKLSLNQKLGNSPQIAGGTSGNVIKPSNPETNKMDSYQIPFGTPGLFRLPTDNQFEATTRANPGTAIQSSFANYPPEIAPGRFLSEPFLESRSAFSGDPFFTVPYRPFTPEMRPGVPPQRSLSQPRLTEGSPNRMNHLDPYANPVLPPVQDSYPFLPDVTLRLPLNEEGASRTSPSSERGLPPVMRLSSYDGRAGPNMYR